MMEHIEPAGIHSGDSYAVLPTFDLSENVLKQMEKLVMNGDTNFKAFKTETKKQIINSEPLDEIDEILTIEPVNYQVIEHFDAYKIYPASIFVTTKERIASAIQHIERDMELQVEMFRAAGKDYEAKRIYERVNYDLEMIKELGYCSGIENYSRYFDGREPGSRPFCLLDYFPKDYLMVIDESHVTVPQIRAMFGGDAARKQNLVEYGFRLPSAKDNRPLKFEEFEELNPQTIYVSATPTLIVTLCG
jgi:excinuclease ABC subunit B